MEHEGHSPGLCLRVYFLEAIRKEFRENSIFLQLNSGSPLERAEGKKLTVNVHPLCQVPSEPYTLISLNYCIFWCIR